MGDLKGHAIPGSFFMVYGLWWSICCLKRFFTCQKGGTRYVATSTYTCPCSCGRFGLLPIEAFIKILLAAAGMFGEITFNMPNPSNGIIQHATMYFFFMMSGIVDMVMHFKIPLPPASDYISLALALMVECLLFANHLHGRPELDVHIHVLLVYVIFATVLVVLLEAKFHRSVILPMARSFLLMLQGTWFWAVGIILYGHGKKNEVWEMDNHMHIMLTTIYFSWHCAVNFIILFLLAIFMYFCFRRINGPFRNGSRLSGIPLTQMENGKDEGYSRLTLNDDRDDDSDIEFEKPVEKSLLPS